MRTGPARTIEFRFTGVSPSALVSIQRVDRDHGNVLKEYASMGSPVDPTPAQVEQLNRSTSLPAPEKLQLKNGGLDLSLDENALVLIKVEK